VPTSAQFRGMLLEEALLFLLRESGYKTVDRVDKKDKTLSQSAAGIQVKGRATNHQIDAIADYQITLPFTYPNRLLVESKATTSSVGIEIIRNALGVLLDIQEYWVPTKTLIQLRQRYHYQYAIASINNFTSEAEKFAFAHDIYLMPLARAGYFRPISVAINAFTDEIEYLDLNTPKDFYRLRLTIRNHLLDSRSPNRSVRKSVNLPDGLTSLIGNFIESCMSVRYGFLAILDRRIPVFLIPNPDVNLSQFFTSPEVWVRIYWDSEGWYIHSNQTNQELFSFDLPEEILKLYLTGGVLSPSRALDLKEENLSEIQLISTIRGRVDFITLQLNIDWLNEIRRRLTG
jgi:hypothetical protein